MSANNYIITQVGCRGEKPKGHTMENKANFNIPEKDLKELDRNFKRMWLYLASAIYYRGGTRGHAEQKALEQMDTFVQIKTKRDNPMNEHLKKLNSEYRKIVSENIMKNEHSNDVFIKRCHGNDIVGERWADGADREFKSALRQFNEFYNKYQPKQNDNKTEFNANNQRLTQMLVQMFYSNNQEGK